MDMETKIRVALSYSKKSQAWLGKQLGVTTQTINQKVKRKTFKQEDLEKIAELIGAKYRCYFEFPDGTIIE